MGEARGRESWGLVPTLDFRLEPSRLFHAFWVEGPVACSDDVGLSSVARTSRMSLCFKCLQASCTKQFGTWIGRHGPAYHSPIPETAAKAPGTLLLMRLRVSMSVDLAAVSQAMACSDLVHWRHQNRIPRAWVVPHALRQGFWVAGSTFVWQSLHAEPEREVRILSWRNMPLASFAASAQHCHPNLFLVSGSRARHALPALFDPEVGPHVSHRGL